MTANLSSSRNRDSKYIGKFSAREGRSSLLHSVSAIRSHLIPDARTVAWHQRDSRNAFRNALRDTSRQSCYAIRSASRSIQRGRLESTPPATDTGHFASSLAPTTRKRERERERDKKKGRSRERGAAECPGGCFRALTEPCTYRVHRVHFRCA